MIIYRECHSIFCDAETVCSVVEDQNPHPDLTRCTISTRNQPQQKTETKKMKGPDARWEMIGRSTTIRALFIALFIIWFKIYIEDNFNFGPELQNQFGWVLDRILTRIWCQNFTNLILYPIMWFFENFGVQIRIILNLNYFEPKLDPIFNWILNWSFWAFWIEFWHKFNTKISEIQFST